MVNKLCVLLSCFALLPRLHPYLSSIHKFFSSSSSSSSASTLLKFSSRKLMLIIDKKYTFRDSALIKKNHLSECDENRQQNIKNEIMNDLCEDIYGIYSNISLMKFN